MFRLAEQAAAAAKALKAQLKVDMIHAAIFMEFAKLRRQGKVDMRLIKMKRIRALAARFGEDDGQPDMLVNGPSEKSIAALAIVDARQAGWDAGLANQSTDACPFDAGSETGDAWRRAHEDARAFLRGTGQSSADEVPAEARPRRSHLREVA